RVTPHPPAQAVGLVNPRVVGVLGERRSRRAPIDLRDEIVATVDVAGCRRAQGLAHPPAERVVAEAYGAHATSPHAVEASEAAPIEPLGGRSRVNAGDKIAVIIVHQAVAVETLRQPVPR